MIRHHCGRWLVAVGVVLAGAGATLAQEAVTLPNEARTAADPGKFQPQIDAFIDAQMKALQSEDPLAQQRARDELVDAVRPQGTVQPGPVFLQAYARSLNRALAALPQTTPLRGRLNAAVALARIADNVRGPANSQLVGAVVKLMQDPAQPVALWGLRAAEDVLPYELGQPLVTTPQNSKILTTLQDVLSKRTDGSLFEEGYIAASLAAGDTSRPLEPKVIKLAVPVVQQIFESRVKAMQAGPVDMPHAEQRAMFFLAFPRIYGAQSAQEKLRSVQLITDFAALLAQRLAANPKDAAALMPVIRYAGSNIGNVGANENNPAVRRVGEQLGQLDNNASPEQVRAAIEQVYTTLKSVPAFANLQGAPQINASPAPNGQAGNAGTLAAQAEER